MSTADGHTPSGLVRMSWRYPPVITGGYRYSAPSGRFATVPHPEGVSMSITPGASRGMAIRWRHSPEGVLFAARCHTPSGLIPLTYARPPVNTGGYRHTAPLGRSTNHHYGITRPEGGVMPITSGISRGIASRAQPSVRPEGARPSITPGVSRGFHHHRNTAP